MKTINRLKALSLGIALTCGSAAQATIVQVTTTLGSFEINLYDQHTPETVANFLAYLEGGTYNPTIVHRTQANFVVQAGGFTLDNEGKVARSAAVWSPPNEPKFANRKGTIAMAKLHGDPNSATNQWFINVADNSAILDNQNGGFTVFGEVMEDGMDVVDAIAAVPRYDVVVGPEVNPNGGAFISVPLRDFAGLTPDAFWANPSDHAILIENITVIDASADTAADLSPEPNTSLRKRKKSGAFDWLTLFSLTTLVGCLSVARMRKHAR